MIEIEVNVTDGASQVIRNLISSLSGSKLAELNKKAGYAAVVAAQAYHREFDVSGGWRGKRYLGTSRGEGSAWGAAVASGWFFKSSDSGGAAIANGAPHYAFKVKGGTITPKRAKYLTIPLIAEARGLMTATYTQNTGRKLFTIPGKSALFEKKENGKGIRPVYALVRSVTMTPWPNALPSNEVIASAFLSRWKNELATIIESS